MAIRESIDEGLRRRFERAWIDGEPLAIEDCLPPRGDAAWLPTLEELVHIELEFAWKAWADHRRGGSQSDASAGPARPPRIEQYLARFPELNQPEIVSRLIEQEFFVRAHAGERPQRDDYRRRFGELSSSVFSAAGDTHQTLAATRAAGGAALDGQPGAATTARSSGPLPRLANYELLDEIGRGGMGIVYRARQLSADRIVALKVVRTDHLSGLRPELRTSAVERFRHEAQAAARLEHEHIVTVYEVGEADGERFFSMRYVEGESLADMLSSGPLAGRRAAAYLEPVARAVAAAHEAGILHRDLKPQNILVDRRTDKALVADFGLAKLLEQSSELTRAGDVMGTPSYMSPEQARDSAKVTVQSDVYSLGATLYHMLTARPPFQASTSLETLRQVREDEPVPPSRLTRGIDRDLETISLTCLHKEPARRYATATALADDLRRYLDGLPIVARPVGRPERALRWCRRNPLLAAALGVAAACLVAALAAMSASYVRTTAALHDKTLALEQSEQSHRQAREVVDQFFKLVSEDLLLNQPGAEPLRNQLLQLALAHDRQFLDRQTLAQRGHDPELLEEIAKSHYRVGQIERTIAPQASAGLNALNEALRIQRELAANQTDNESLLDALGDTLNALGQVHLQRGDAAVALELFEEARQARFTLAGDGDEQRDSRRKLANAVMNASLAHKHLRQYEQAAAAIDEAQAIRKRMLEGREIDSAEGLDLLVWRDLAMGHYNRATLALARGAAQDADAAIDEGLPIFEAIARLEPGDLNNRKQLAIVCRLLGQSSYAQRVDAAAAAYYQRAIDLLTDLHRGSPRVPEFQEQLALSHVDLAKLHSRRRNVEAAAAALAVACEHLRQIIPPAEATGHRDRRFSYATALRQLAEQQLKLDRPDDAAANLRLARDYLGQLVEQAGDSPRRETFEGDLEETQRLLAPLESL